jgi:hypothetical protein
VGLIRPRIRLDLCVSPPRLIIRKNRAPPLSRAAAQPRRRSAAPPLSRAAAQPPPLDLAQAAKPERGGVGGEALVVGQGQGGLGELGQGLRR